MALPRPRRSPAFASTAVPAQRWVQVDDAELLRRLQRVRARREALDGAVDLASGRWKWEGNKKSFSVYSRRRASSSSSSSSVATATATAIGYTGGSEPESSRRGDDKSSEELDGRCVGEVVATGTVVASVDKLAARFRAASESDLNARMKALYKAQFIYGTVVHAVVLPDRSGRSATAWTDSDGLGASQLESYSHHRNRGGGGDISSSNATTRSRVSHSTVADGTALHVTVKTCSFARPRSLACIGARNEQWCVVEQFRRTALGFALEFASMDVGEISLGKARPDSVDELQPVSGWLSVEQAAPNSPLRVVFRALVEPRARQSRLTRYCTPKATLARLIELGKGMSRLGDAAVARSAVALGEESRANSHCISCTARLRLASRLTGRQRRCQLCFYTACADCCRREQLMIYNRYTAALDVCHRCKESMQGGEYSHLQLVAAKRHGSHGSLSLFPSDRGFPGVDACARSAVNV